MYFVSDVSRKPRKTVSSSSGASTAVTVKRLKYVGVLILMIRATASTVPPPPPPAASCTARRSLERRIGRRGLRFWQGLCGIWKD